jgi:hypothetical protein
MRRNQVLIALSTALAIGLLGSASAALANDSGENNMGGYVVPGSMAGVNPVYHPELFGRTTSGRTTSGRNAYGSVLIDRKPRSTAERSQDR